MIYQDYIRVLYLNLDNHSYYVENRKDLKQYIGGVGVASKLLEENIKPELEVFDRSQCIVFAIGAISNIFPVITKTVAMFYSPLTKELGESYAGGRMAMSMFMSGYDALVITGKSEKPIYLSLTRNNVEFKDASAIWGMPNDDVGRIIREKESGAGKRSILRIGTAGEKLVKYGSVCVDTYRHFGRMGLGAVMGSKNLKAISILAKGSTQIQNTNEYLKTFKEIYTKSVSTDVMKKYHDLGTAIGVNLMNEMGGIPINNLAATHMEDIEPLSGEAFAENNLVRKTACAGCPVGCIHIGQFRREFGKGFEFEAISVGYDYELIFSLGTFLGLRKSDEVLEIIEAVEEYGLDAISAGVTLGYATEAYKNNLFGIDKCLIPMELGNKQNYLEAIRNIAKRTNEFYYNLGEGCASASAIYGGEDYAMHFGGNEMSGYHTGYGSVLGSAVGARHSHLCNGGYGFDQTHQLTPLEIVDKVFNEEIDRCLLNSLISCLFARKLYDKPTILQAFNSVGMNYTGETLDAAAREIYKIKLRIKKMLKYDQTKIKLPKRFFETEGFGTRIDENTMYELIGLFNQKNEELLMG